MTAYGPNPNPFSHTMPKPTRSFRVPLSAMAALLVGSMALLTGTSLWLLRQMNEKASRRTATISVLRQGRVLTEEISKVGRHARAVPDPRLWSELNNLIASLAATHEGLQYVSVSSGGITIFHRQTSDMDPAPPLPPMPPQTEPAQPPRLTVARRVLDVRGTEVPVVVFKREFSNMKGSEIVVELGLKRDMVNLEQRDAAAAIGSMFRISLLTVIVAFGICVLMIVALMQREQRRERRRHQEEHLAFSGVLANGIVHDFRNPMSSVRLDAQMLERQSVKLGEDQASGRVQELSRRIRHTLDRMDRVFQEFLYLSKPAEAADESLDLCACTEACLEILHPRFEHADVRAETAWDERPLLIHGSDTALRRALVNVIVNALQFSPKKASIDVLGRREGTRIVLEIMDRGPGIPARERKRVFEMFKTTRPGGTGLGLFLARTAIENCEGAISAHAREGGGTCIRIELPAEESDQP